MNRSKLFKIKEYFKNISAYCCMLIDKKKNIASYFMEHLNVLNYIMFVNLFHFYLVIINSVNNKRFKDMLLTGHEKDSVKTELL